MARIAVLAAMVLFAAVAQAQMSQRPPAARPAAGPDTATLVIQFDNRGSKVQGKQKAVIPVVAKMLKVPASQVSMNVLGQSGITNHQAVASFTASGPATNGRSVYDNCAAAVKSGWFSGSEAKKELKKATDTWMPGDSLSVQSASCSAPGRPQVKGRKML